VVNRLFTTLPYLHGTGSLGDDLMNIILAAFMAGPMLLPEIDRRELKMQARTELLVSTTPRGRTRGNRPARAPDLASTAAVRTICAAAQSQADPRAFLSRLSLAYRLDPVEREGLRSRCDGYFLGQADSKSLRGDTY
jgi:hypothetical protein